MLEIKTDISLSSLTTFKIGGAAKYFCEVANADDLKEAFNFSRQKKLPFFILGGGSNLLADDRGFVGLIIKIKNEKIKIKKENEEVAILEIGAGVLLKDLVLFCLENKLSGFEWASGIPKATLGGALYMNAGAFGQKIADVVEKVFALDAKTGKEKELSFAQCVFGYKESIFSQNKNLIILSAVLQLEKKENSEIKKEMRRVLEYRKANHPMRFSSAGSVFKNPKNFSAAELIEKCGLKGKAAGGAEISRKHANFIVNLGNARAADVKKLIAEIKKQAKNKFKINLEEEIEYLQNIFL